MFSRIAFFAVCLLVLSAAASGQQPDRPDPADLEEKLLKAIGQRQSAVVEEVGAQLVRLNEDQRRALRFRVRPGVVEFRFRGISPGHSDIEFLLSNKNRDYESLLVLDKTKFARAGRVWTAAKGAKLIGPPFVEFKLVWVEKGEPRTESLEDVFRKFVAKEGQDRYYRHFEWEDDGLRIPNIPVDPAAVPKAGQVAEMLVILRPAFLSK